MGLIEDLQAKQLQRITRPALPSIIDITPSTLAAQLGNGTGVGGGFRPASSITRKWRLILSIEALEKTGKSHLALTSTAVGKVAVHNFDVGLEGVVNKFDTDKIIVADYRMPRIVGLDPQAASNTAHAVWSQFVNDYDQVLLVDDVRTIVWDTATENWDLLRIARFGKLTQIMPHMYGPVNAEYREQIRKAYDTDKNLILLHKLGAEWENFMVDGKEKGRKTGRFERKGFSDMGFAVQVVVRAWKETPEIGKPPIFRLAITECRQNPSAEGVVLEGEMATFSNIAMAVYPDSDPVHWGL